MTQGEIEQALKAALISIAVAAAILAVSDDTIRNYIKQGLIEAVKIDRPGGKYSTYRVRSSSIRKLVGLDE